MEATPTIAYVINASKDVKNSFNRSHEENSVGFLSYPTRATNSPWGQSTHFVPFYNVRSNRPMIWLESTQNDSNER